MSGRSKQTFFQRRHTDDQEAHEKMLSITNCYRNEKQNHSKISSHSSLNAHQQQQKNLQTVGSTLVAQWLGFWAFTAAA